MENSLKNNASTIGAPDTADTQQANWHYRRNVTFDALVLDAKLRQSLVTVRSLGRHNKKVAALEVANALEQSRHVPAFASRWCQRSSVAPAYVYDVEPFLAYLQQWLDTTGARVLITSSDGTLAVLREHRARIEQHGVRVALADEPALAIALNKDQTLEIAQRLGLGVPGGVMLRSVAEVNEAIHDVGLPAVVKPAETWQWGEQRGMRLISILVTTPEEARRAVEKLTQNDGVVLFQQFLTGRREAVSFIYAYGELYARFAQWAMRTHPQLGGTSVFRQSIPVPEDIGEQAERLIREIGLEGYSEVEFRRDALGKPYLMEINPRLSASVEVATRAGVDFPYLLYQWASGEPIDHIEGYRPGGWMRYLEGDILATIQSFIDRGRPEVTPPGQALYEFLSAFFIPSGYDYIDWQDLAPASYAVCEFMDRVCYKLGKRS